MQRRSAPARRAAHAPRVARAARAVRAVRVVRGAGALAALQALASPLEAAAEAIGCFHYDYAYSWFSPESSSTRDNASQCQAQCASTAGCSSFTFAARERRCALVAGGGAMSGRAASLVDALGATSGPAACPAGAFALGCLDVPAGSFPPATVSSAMAAWPSGEAPTSLQCWPRDLEGSLLACTAEGADNATVLEDTHDGWPGKCEQLQHQVGLGSASCMQRCRQRPDCGVWQTVVDVAGDWQCWQGGMGASCYGRPGFFPVAGQRLLHGSYRVLRSLEGVQILGLVNIFQPTAFDKWEAAGARCRLSCVADLYCQYWTYSTIYGCWAEDPSTFKVAHPLTKDNAVKSGHFAISVVAGEYIQHLCASPSPERGLRSGADALAALQAAAAPRPAHPPLQEAGAANAAPGTILPKTWPHPSSPKASGGRSTFSVLQSCIMGVVILTACGFTAGCLCCKEFSRWFLCGSGEARTERGVQLMSSLRPQDYAGATKAKTRQADVEAGSSSGEEDSRWELRSLLSRCT